MDLLLGCTYNRKTLSSIFADGITVANILFNIILRINTIWEKTIHIFACATFNFIEVIGPLETIQGIPWNMYALFQVGRTVIAKYLEKSVLNYLLSDIVSHPSSSYILFKLVPCQLVIDKAA